MTYRQITMIIKQIYYLAKREKIPGFFCGVNVRHLLVHLLSQSMLVLVCDCRSSIEMRPDRQVTEFSRGLRAFSGGRRLSGPIRTESSGKRRKERRQDG